MSYLKDTVDYIFLIESNQTHSGMDKKFYYVDKYKEILNSINDTGKLIVEKIDFPDNLKLAWHREKHQRNIAKSIILNHMGSRKFILIVGDADEIPRKELLESFPKRYDEFNEPKHLRMIFHYYSFKWVTKDMWSQAFVVNDVGLATLHKLSDERVKRVGFSTIDNAGWHCSYFMTANDVINKLKSFAHQEFNHENYQNLEWVQKSIDEGKDLFNRTRRHAVDIRRADGSHGFPYCHNCNNLPGYGLFKIPNITSTSTS
jgi:hypothetical protein